MIVKLDRHKFLLKLCIIIISSSSNITITIIIVFGVLSAHICHLQAIPPMVRKLSYN